MCIFLLALALIGALFPASALAWPGTLLDVPGGDTLNGELVAAGLAWVYWPYCKARFCRGWGKAEKKARREKLGLWQEEKPERPDKWRRKNPRR